MKSKINIILSVIIITSILSCETDYGQFNRDNRPDIPVQFVNTTSFGHDPYIEINQSGDGQIEFTMQIPENSGRTIREISKVAAGNTGINVGTLNSDGDYINAPIAGSGNRVTFTTSLEEFQEKRPGVAITIPANGFAEIAFMFEVILDNGEAIVPMRARARIRP